MRAPPATAPATPPAPWPSFAGEVEEPQRWRARIEEAVGACGLGDLVDMDCSEYPCMAVLRVSGEGEERRDEALETLRHKLHACDPLHTAFGWDSSDPEVDFGGLVVDASPVDECPEELAALIVAFPKGAPAVTGTLSATDNAQMDASILARTARAHEGWDCKTRVGDFESSVP